MYIFTIIGLSYADEGNTITGKCAVPHIGQCRNDTGSGRTSSDLIPIKGQSMNRIFPMGFPLALLVSRQIYAAALNTVSGAGMF